MRTSSAPITERPTVCVVRRTQALRGECRAWSAPLESARSTIASLGLPGRLRTDQRRIRGRLSPAYRVRCFRLGRAPRPSGVDNDHFPAPRSISVQSDRAVKRLSKALSTVPAGSAESTRSSRCKCGTFELGGRPCAPDTFAGRGSGSTNRKVTPWAVSLRPPGSATDGCADV